MIEMRYQNRDTLAKIKRMNETMRRSLTIFIQKIAKSFVKQEAKLMAVGNYQRTGPRGGRYPVPPPVASQLTSRHGYRGLKGAYTFDMITPLTAMAYVRSMAARSDPAVYSLALFHHGGVAWSPPHGAWELMRRDIAKRMASFIEQLVADNPNPGASGNE